MPALARNLGLGYLALCLLLLVSMFAGGPRFYAPVALVPEPQLEPVTLVFAYSSEKDAWLQEALTAFEQSGPEVDGRPIKVERRSLSTGQISEDLISGRLQPAAISPASMLELRLIESRWTAAHGGQPMLATDALAPQPLVLTPLVLVGWKTKIGDRWPGDAFSWTDLSQAATAQNNSYLKLSHTRPTRSNSGLLALILAAYEFYSQPDLTPADVQGASFRDWLRSFEENLNWPSDASADSSRQLVESMVTRGPASFDGVITYENLALQYASSPRVQGNELHLYYPRANIWADHPLAILASASPEQQQAARQLRDFLLGAEAQRRALLLGFRPTNQSVSIGDQDPANPFNKTSYGVKQTIDQQAKEPSVEVTQALLDLWSREVNR